MFTLKTINTCPLIWLLVVQQWFPIVIVGREFGKSDFVVVAVKNECVEENLLWITALKSRFLATFTESYRSMCRGTWGVERLGTLHDFATTTRSFPALMNHPFHLFKSFSSLSIQICLFLFVFCFFFFKHTDQKKIIEIIVSHLSAMNARETTSSLRRVALVFVHASIFSR